MNNTSRINALKSQIGVIGDGTHVEGGMHFYYPTSAVSPTGKLLQRPPRAQYFTGRERELAQLLADLQPGRVVTLCGPGGIGKTALAAEAVWTLASGNEPPERFPDGVIFHSFYGRPDVALAFEHIVRSFDETARDTSAEAVRRALSNKQALLILDGTEEAKDLGAVLAVRGGCGVLVTSRARRDAVAERQDVRPLAADDAVELLRAWGKGQAADEAADRRICELLGRLPLAVRLAGRYLDQTEESAVEYLEWLEETPIEALSHGEHREESVELLLARSLGQVSEGAREVLAVVGLLALAPFSVEAVAEAMGLGTRMAKRLLGELVSYGLLLRGGERYEVSHALVHIYARRRMAVSDEVTGRLAAYYTQLAEAESEKGLEGYGRLDAERGHLVAILAWCVKRKHWEATTNLARAVDTYLNIQGHWTERVAVLSAGLAAARGLKHHVDERRFLNALGPAYRVLGQVKRALEHYEQALAIACEIGDRRAESIQLSGLGNIYRDQGQVERAIEHYEQALAIAREVGDRRAESIQLSCLGNAYRDLGQVERSIEYYGQALAIAREIRDRRGASIQLSCLGNAYRDLKQVEQAVEFYEQALAIAREVGDRHGESIQLSCLGNAHCDLGQMERSIEHYGQALAIAREIGDRHGENIQLGGLGLAYRALGQVERAIEYAEQGLRIAREINAPLSEGFRLTELGLAYRDLGQAEQARRCLQQSLAIFEEIKSPYAEQARSLLAELED